MAVRSKYIIPHAKATATITVLVVDRPLAASSSTGVLSVAFTAGTEPRDEDAVLPILLPLRPTFDLITPPNVSAREELMVFFAVGLFASIVWGDLSLRKSTSY